MRTQEEHVFDAEVNCAGTVVGAKRLNEKWREIQITAVEGFFALGHDLIEAKGQLGVPIFVEMVREDLDISQNTANAFIRIAFWEEIVGNAHNRLPPDWTTIDKLTRLDEEVFKRKCLTSRRSCGAGYRSTSPRSPRF
jgi:hypothetical protein